MLDFKLLPGDKYDARCAEIYITEKQFLIYHCSMCDEIYATFNELLSHINKKHYENTKEHSTEAENKSVEIISLNEVKRDETQLAAKNFVKNEKSNKQFDSNLENASTNSETTLNRYQAQASVTVSEIPLLKVFKETEDLPRFSIHSKNSPLLKKSRIVKGMLKNHVIWRTNLNTLTRYQINSNEERKYICGECGFAFKEKYNLRNHLLRHSNQKNCCSKTCPKKFFSKVELRLHEYRHKGGRPHLCNHCGMGFFSSGSLTQHIKRHHSLHKPFKCDHCEIIFPNFNQLRDHQIVHTDERIFQCAYSHLNMQENKRKYRCENCDIGFSTETTFIQHKNKLNDISSYELDTERHIIEGNYNENEGDSDDNEGKFVGELVLEQNFDEYELVQTLTDLECNKHV